VHVNIDEINHRSNDCNLKRNEVYATSFLPFLLKEPKQSQKLTLRPNLNLQGQTYLKRPMKCRSAKSKFSRPNALKNWLIWLCARPNGNLGAAGGEYVAGNCVAGCPIISRPTQELSTCVLKGRIQHIPPRMRNSSRLIAVKRHENIYPVLRGMTRSQSNRYTVVICVTLKDKRVIPDRNPKLNATRSGYKLSPKSNRFFFGPSLFHRISLNSVEQFFFVILLQTGRQTKEQTN